MIHSSQNQNVKLNNVCLYLMVITTLIGAMIYIGFASLYHFVVFALLLLVLYKGIHTGNLRTSIMAFLAVWAIEAILSVIWSPDKMLTLQYAYYIFLIMSVCILFHTFLFKDNIMKFAHFMVLVLFVCNLIAFWEMNTGKHLVADYLSTPLRLRLLKFVPGGFYRNPNDFATFIIQIIPFSFMGLSFSKRFFRLISLFNLVAAFVVICATQSRTQILLILAFYIFFVVIYRKQALLKFCLVACVIATVLYFVYPEFTELIDGALESISGKSLVANINAEGGSLNTRINLLKNAGYILFDTFGFGIGAGCHRVVMAEYSVEYFNTYGILVMHNLLGELFADYGWFIGIFFIVAICSSVSHLFRIYKSEESYNIRLLAAMLAFSMGVMIICGMSSSSIIQLTSVWMTFCFTSAFINLYKVK